MNWPPPQNARRVQRIAVATHNPRFFTPIRALLAAEGDVLLDDEWQGHRRHHEPLSRSAAAWADVVFAEWCLGNAVWHAAHRRPDARLVVRLHRFELETGFPGELDLDAVDTVVFVGPHVRQEAIDRFGWPAAKCLLIPNAVDTGVMGRSKGVNARFTLGLLTWHRRLKRLDLALDLLEVLRAEDRRYELRVKGHRPEDLPHVWKYDDERAYFERQYERIAASPLLDGHVHFDPQGPDVVDWFTRIGHVLSLSDVESFHLALAEGMASGAVPVIRARPGADDLFSPAWIAGDVPAMAEHVQAHTDTMPWAEAGQRARREIIDRYDASVVGPQWLDLLRGASASVPTR